MLKVALAYFRDVWNSCWVSSLGWHFYYCFSDFYYCSYLLMYSHFQEDLVSLTGLVFFPRTSRTSRYTWSTWKRGSLGDSGEHRTSRQTGSKRRGWAQR